MLVDVRGGYHETRRGDFKALCSCDKETLRWSAPMRSHCTRDGLEEKDRGGGLEARMAARGAKVEIT
jgi:hypothetical protein